MAPYLFLAVAVMAITLLGAPVRQHFHKEAARKGRESRGSWTFFDLIAVAVLIGFSAVRFEVGSDFENYIRRFGRMDPANWEWHLGDSPEVVFTTLLLVTKSVSDSPIAFLLVTSALTVIPVYAAIMRYSSRPVLAVTLYVLLAFYPGPFNIVAQGIAISLIFWAIVTLRHRRVWLILVGVIATLIHTSAAIALVIMWLAYRRRPSPRVSVTIVIGAAVLALAYDRLGFLQTLVGFLTPQYEQHLDSGEAGIGTYLTIAAYLALLLYAAFLGRGRDTGGDGWLVTYVLIGVAFMIVGTQAVLISRLALYFTIFLVLLLPERIALVRYRARHDLALVASGLVFYTFYLENYGNLTPYQTYFS